MEMERPGLVPRRDRLHQRGKARRAIDIREGQLVDATAFKALIKATVAQNLGAAKKR